MAVRRIDAFNKAILTEFEVTCSSVQEESLKESIVRGFRIDTLLVKSDGFTIKFSFEILIPLLFEILSNL